MILELHQKKWSLIATEKLTTSPDFLSTKKLMHLIQRAISLSSDLNEEHQIILHAERRQFLKRRWRGQADDGTEFGFDLEERLTDGCVIFHQEGKDYLVRQTKEKVFCIPFIHPAQAALIAWKTGNLHMPAQITEHALYVLHDDAMRNLIERENWEYTEPEILFTPMKAVPHT